MIRGRVTADGAPRVRIEILDEMGQAKPIAAVLDTGFTGDLSLPSSSLSSLGLRPVGQRMFRLADGGTSVMNTYAGSVNWHDKARDILVVESEGTAMVGMNLIWGSRVTLEAREDGDIVIEPLPRPA